MCFSKPLFYILFICFYFNFSSFAFYTFFGKFIAKYFDALIQCRNVLDFNRKLFRGKFMYMNRDFKQGIWLSIVFSGVKTKTNKIMEICVGVGWGSIQTQVKSFFAKGKQDTIAKNKTFYIVQNFPEKVQFCLNCIGNAHQKCSVQQFLYSKLKRKTRRVVSSSEIEI